MVHYHRVEYKGGGSSGGGGGSSGGGSGSSGPKGEFIPKDTVIVDGVEYKGGYKGETISQKQTRRRFEEGSSFSGTSGTTAVGRTKEGELVEQLGQGEEQPLQRELREEPVKVEEKFLPSQAKKESIEQQALLLQASQQYVKGSARFEALRASRLAEKKKQIKKPTETKAEFVGGKIKVSGTVRPAVNVREEKIKQRYGEPTGASIDIYKPSIFERLDISGKGATLGEKARRFIEEEEGSLKGQAVATAYLGARYAKGGVKGLFYLIDLRNYKPVVTYVLAPEMYKARLREQAVKKVEETAGGIGPAIMEDPGILAEEAGFMKGFGTSAKLITNPLVKTIAKPTTSTYAKVELRPEKLTAKQFKAIKSLRSEAPPEVSKALGGEGISKSGEGLIIKVNTLKQKELELLKTLEAKKKLSILQDIEVTVGATKPGKVGFSIKPQRQTSKLTLEYNKKLADKLIKAIDKQTRKSKAGLEKAEIRRTKELTSTELEKTIRKRMAKTGKTAEEVYAEIKGDKKFLRERKAEELFLKKVEKESKYLKGTEGKKEAIRAGREARKEIFKKQKEAEVIDLMEQSSKPKKSFFKEMKKRFKLIEKSEQEKKVKLLVKEKEKLSPKRKEVPQSQEEINFYLQKPQKPPKPGKPNLGEKGGFKSLGGGKSKYILVEETQIYRGAKPIKYTEFPTVKNIQTAKFIHEFPKVGVYVPVTATATIPLQQDKTIVTPTEKTTLSVTPAEKTALKVDALTSQGIRQSISTDTRIQQDIITGIQTTTKTRQETRAEIDTILELQTSQKITGKTTTGLELIRPYIPDTKRKQEPEYTISVKKEGIFRQIGRAKSLKEAVARGSLAVDISPSASFKVSGPDSPGAGGEYLPSGRFRRSKTEEGVFVEKRRFRISTPGEKLGITSRGLATIKLKKSKTKFGF